jgi:starch phosphorylase
MPGTRFTIEVRPSLPQSLSRLADLAGNLVYTWDRDLRRLFRQLDNELYEACGANLKLFLRRVSQQRLNDAENNPEFMSAFQEVLRRYDRYRARTLRKDLESYLDPESDLVAYFCFEFGFHESLPLYSGGLGILAADHCKAASDLAVPLVGVGLLYHQAYFEQLIDPDGNQQEHYANTDFDALPLEITTADDGAELHVTAPVGTGEVKLRVWRARAGNADLLLLDSNLNDNPEPLRSITHRLYGGNRIDRIRQEIVLGIGGVRAVRKLGFKPTVWHLNEGHAAFQTVERVCERMSGGCSFDRALEQVAASTVFTTHTPVPAGHDVFDGAEVAQELGPYLRQIGEDAERLLSIGRNDHPGQLNMTSLALRGSRFHNGVSRIHGDVAAANESYVWPEVPPEENPLTYVTNGVHLQTFLALEWVTLFDQRFPDWRNHLGDEAYWSCLDSISDDDFFRLKEELKAQLFVNLKRRLVSQHRRNGLAESTVERLTSFEHSADALVLGFARRFATYKRANLLFADFERAVRLFNDPERPVLIVMAGKAHPHDEPGKKLIRQIHQLSQRPEFLGRLHLVENYDIALARQLVAGVDVWLNTPEHPLEASGTSGMKAGVNGTVNLSVLDGWWAEAYDGSNGWAIRPHAPDWDQAYREREEANDLMDLLERRVVSTYFHDKPAWAELARASMRTLIPRFNAERMVREYVTRLYGPAALAARRLAADDGAGAAELVEWKQRICACWEGVSISRDDTPPAQVGDGDSVALSVSANLNGLDPEDVRIECLVENGMLGRPMERTVTRFDYVGGSHPARFVLSFQPPFPGLQNYRIRIYPWHELLAHPYEMGRMRWV